MKALKGKINNNEVTFEVRETVDNRHKMDIMATLKSGKQAQEFPIIIEKVSSQPLTRDEYTEVFKHVTRDFETVLRYAQAGAVKVIVDLKTGEIKRFQ